MNTNKIINITNKLVDDFCQVESRDNYNLLCDFEDIKPPEIYPLNTNNNDELKELKDIATDYVTKNYFDKYNTAEKTFTLVNNVFNHAINRYCINNGIDPINIKFVSKGGLIAYMFKNYYINKISKSNIRKLFHNNYDTYFKKSDMDFTIIINSDLDDIIYDRCYKDMSDLSFFLLYIIRTHFRKFLYEYMDYYKYNNKYKITLLNEMKEKINTSNFIKEKKKNNIYCCKLIHKNDYVESPCIRDVRFNKEKKYDSIIKTTADPRNMQINYPAFVGNKHFNPTNDMYITYNNTIDFVSDSGIHTKFFLARIKALFSLYFINHNQHIVEMDGLSCCNFENIGGEIIDVSIGHKSSDHKMSIENGVDIMSTSIRNSDDIINIPTLDYMLKDLHFILFSFSKYPWSNSKTKKRVFRYIFFILLHIFISQDEEMMNQEVHNIDITVSKLSEIIYNINAFQERYINGDVVFVYPVCKNGAVTQEECNLLYNNATTLNIDEDVEDETILLSKSCFWNQNLGRCLQALFPFVFVFPNSIFNNLLKSINELIKKISIDKLNNDTDFDSNLKNLKEFVINVKKSMEILHEGLDINLNQDLDQEGVIEREPSVMTLEKKYLRKEISILKNKYLKYKNKYLKNYKQNQKGGFNTCSKDKKHFVVPLILDSFTKFDSFSLTSSYNNIFHNVYEKLIANFKNDRQHFQEFKSYDGNDDYRSPPFHNYSQNITALAFLSFMIEYQLFLNFYMLYSPQPVKTFNTVKNNRRNNYTPNFKGRDLSVRIYRNKLDNINIEELLNDFCIELDRLYRRFMVTLITNIKIISNDKINPDGTIEEFSFNEIRDIIIPGFMMKDRNIDDKYEFLFYNWKQRLIEDNIINNLSQIDQSIKKSLEYNLDQYSIDNAYTPDGTGFFSWMYMIPKIDEDNMSKKFGSCITSTYLEAYLLLRIHEKPEDVNLGLEIDEGYHPVWQRTIRDVGSNLGHWTTIWNNNTSENPYTFRKIAPARGLSDAPLSGPGNRINLITNKKLFLQVLIFIIFDAYQQYAALNKNKLGRARFRNISKNIWESYSVLKGIVNDEL